MLYRFDEFVVDDSLYEIRRGDITVPMERRVFDLLLLLVQNSDRTVSKTEIFDHVWQGRRVSGKSLGVAMTALRRALGDDAESPRILRTVRGRGYRFIAPVIEEPDARGSSRSSAATRFVGRQAELRALAKALEAARKGTRQVFLISGEAGIGKTRLCEEFCARSRRSGVLAIAARCLEEDGTPAFWPWTQVLRAAMNHGGGVGMWPRSMREALGSIVPDIVGDSGAPPSGEGDAATARFRVFDAVAQVVNAAAGSGGLILFIDDIHRADPASLVLLEFLVMQLNDSPILVLLAQRDALVQQSELHRNAMARIARGPRTHLLQLTGLARSEVDELMTDIGAERRINSDTILDLTGGNPLFVAQIAPFVQPGAADARPLPATVRDSIARQLDGLSDVAQHVLQRASVLGRSFSPTLLVRMCSDQLVVEETLRASASAHLVERASESDTYRFRHALVRDVLYEMIPANFRARLHWEAADVIELILGPEVESHFSEIAFHRYCGASAGDIGNAIESCRRAGIFASSHLAYEEAALQFSRGLELAEKSASQNAELRCDLLLALGAEEVRSGERDSAAANFARAAAVARTLGDAERLASAALGRFPGFFAVEAGAPDQFAIDLLREAIAVTPVDQERMRALLLARLAMAISWCDGAGEREGLTAEASRIALAHGDSSLRLQVSLARWFAEWEPEQFEKRWAIADLLMADGGRHGDRETVLLCRLFHATCLLERGEIREFKRQVAIFEEAASHLRQPEALWYSALLQAMFSLHLGRLQEADALSRRFAELGQIVRDANVFHSRTSHRVLLAWETGDLDEMIDAASEGSDAFPAMDGWHAAKAWALARAGRVAEAQRTIHIVARDGVSGIPRRMDWMVTLATLGEASVLVGDLVRAREVFEEMACLRGRVIVLGLCVATWGCASRYLGTLARSLGKWELAEELLREAVEVDTRTEANAWAAWSKYELGDLLVSRPAASIASSHEGSNWLAAAGECAQALDLRWLKTKLASRNLLLYDGTKY